MSSLSSRALKRRRADENEWNIAGLLSSSTPPTSAPCSPTDAPSVPYRDTLNDTHVSSAHGDPGDSRLSERTLHSEISGLLASIETAELPRQDDLLLLDDDDGEEDGDDR